MSLKVLDSQGRWRNKTIAFRMSPEEDELLERLVALSGLTKQEYIINRLLNRNVVVNGNPRVYKALKDQLDAVYGELCRVKDARGLSVDQLVLIRQIATIMEGMKEGNG